MTRIMMTVLSTATVTALTSPGKQAGGPITIVVIVALTIGAIALGVKFFNTSVDEQEDQKGWKD